MATGQPRADVRHRCGTVHHGFITQMNWALLGDGGHTAVAYDDGVEFARSTFTVVTTGEEFVTGVYAECRVSDFPDPGENARLEWNESTQHFELAEVGAQSWVPPEDNLLHHITTSECGLYVSEDGEEWHPSLDSSHQGRGDYDFYYGPYRRRVAIETPTDFAACLPARHMFVPGARCVSPPSLMPHLEYAPPVNVFHGGEEYNKGGTTIMAGSGGVIVTPDVRLHPTTQYGEIAALTSEGDLRLSSNVEQFTVSEGSWSARIDPDIAGGYYTAERIDTEGGRLGRTLRAIRQGIRNISDRNFTPSWRACRR